MCHSTTIFAAGRNQANEPQIMNSQVYLTQPQKQAMQLVNNVTRYNQLHNLTQTYAAVMDNKLFRNGQYYAFMLNQQGTMLAHGYNLNTNDSIANITTMSGQNLANAIYNTANHPDGGWVSYLWHNPDNGKRQLKLAYFKMLPCVKDSPCKNIIVGSGYYPN